MTFEKEILAEENYNLIYFVVNKYINTEKYNTDDLIGTAEIGYTKALNTFDVDKGYQFSTYAIKCIQNELLGFLRKENKYNKNNILLKKSSDEDVDFTINAVIDTLANKFEGDKEKSIDDIIIEKEEISLLYKYISQLTEQEQYVIKLRYGLYNSDMKTQKEIGEDLKLSQSYINRIEKQALKKLYNNMKKN